MTNLEKELNNIEAALIRRAIKVRDVNPDKWRVYKHCEATRVWNRYMEQKARNHWINGIEEYFLHTFADRMVSAIMAAV